VPSCRSCDEVRRVRNNYISKADIGEQCGTRTLDCTEIYAPDAFLQALGDLELRRRIMLTCPPPTTLDAVYDLALRASVFESYACKTLKVNNVRDHLSGKVNAIQESSPAKVADASMEHQLNEIGSKKNTISCENKLRSCAPP